jgi:hypothetical protein
MENLNTRDLADLLNATANIMEAFKGDQGYPSVAKAAANSALKILAQIDVKVKNIPTNQ